MELVILSIHLLVCICLIGLVLLQRSEGGALGMGGGSSSIMTGRGAADALARMTSVAGGFFLVTSLGLTLLSSAGNANAGRSVMDIVPEQSAPVATPAPEAPAPQAVPEETRPDPTESRAPSNTQLVSLGPREAAAATPPPPSNATRAGPIDQRPAATTAPAQRPAATPTSTQPRAQTPPPATTLRSGSATTQPAATQAPRQTPAPAATNGAVNGIDLTTDPQLGSESSESDIGVVRRERAGPDQ